MATIRMTVLQLTVRTATGCGCLYCIHSFTFRRLRSAPRSEFHTQKRVYSTEEWSPLHATHYTDALIKG